MSSVMGMIYTGEGDANLRELTVSRSICALPFAGRYRIIDFLLSNMVNTGIRNVGVIMQKNYHSLIDHLGSGKEWDLHGKNDGLLLLPPFLTRENVGVYAGSLDAMRSNLSYLRRSKQEYIVFANSNLVFSTDFSDMLRYHIDSKADVTVMYSKDPSLRRTEAGYYLKLDETNKVTSMAVAPTVPGENTSLHVYIMKREYMKELVENGASSGLHSFTQDILQRMVSDGTMNMNAYEFTGKAYLIDSVQSYFDSSLALLESSTRRELFPVNYPVLTKVRDEMPARYMAGSLVQNSLVADGCCIEGKVENSILFRGVKIAPGAHVRNSIIFQDGNIAEGTHLENCIIDKGATIKKSTTLIGPAAYPIVIAKGVIV